MVKLKDKRREEFCQQYVIDFNGARAARDAGFSKKGSDVRASLLLVNVKVQERVAELMRNRSERTQITQDMVLRELATLGFSDFRDYGEVVKESGADRLRLKTFKEVKGEATRAIKSITEHVTKDGVQLKFNLHSKERPLELLGKHLGMFADRFNVGVSGSMNITVISAVPRPKENNSEAEEENK